MINYGQNYPLKDPSTVVEIDYDDLVACVYDPTKYKLKFTVSKEMGNNGFFAVHFNNLPQELSGSYTSLEKAVEAVCNWLKNAKQSFAVKSDELDKARKERNAAKSKPTSGQLL